MGKLSVVLIDFGSSCYVNQTTYTYIQVKCLKQCSSAVLLAMV
jgi:hypothetical protein